MQFIPLSPGGASRWRSPWVLTATGLFAIGLALSAPSVVVRSLVSLPLLAVPGACLLTAVLGGAAVALDSVTFWALAVLGSVVMMIAEALLLTALGVPLGQRSFGVAAAVLLTALAAASVARLHRRPDSRRPTHAIRPASAVAFAAAAAVAVTGAVVAGRVLPGPVRPGYVAFHLSGSWAYVERAVPVQTGQPVHVPLELHPSRQAASAVYRISAQMDGRPATSGISRVVWRGDAYYGAVTLTAPRDGCTHRLTLNAQADTGWHGQIVLYLRGTGSLGCQKP